VRKGKFYQRMRHLANELVTSQSFLFTFYS